MENTAIVTGVSGMDGAVMSDKLIKKGYTVYGVVRQSASPNYWRLNTLGLLNHPKFKLLTCDLTDFSGVFSMVAEIQPDLILNFGAMSQVGTSFEMPEATMMVDTMTPLCFLEAIRQTSPVSRFYTASSSEMYGNEKDDDGRCNETSKMVPVSPYGVAKLAAHNLVRIYRDSYNLFACAGILFNHTCWARGEYFVEKKIAKYVARHYCDRIDPGEKLTLGNLHASRDVGYSPDYMDGVCLMMAADYPDDYVLCTGQTLTIEDMLTVAFAYIGFNWQDFVVSDSKFCRPNELSVLRGDCSKAVQKLGWRNTMGFTQIMHELIEYEIEALYKTSSKRSPCCKG